MRRLALLLVIVLTLSLLPLLCSMPSLWAQGQLIPGNRTLAGTLNAGPSTGTGAAYVLTLNPPITAYVQDQVFMFRAHTDNTGPATLAVNGAGARPMKKWTGGVLNDLAVGDIKAGQQVTAAYDGTVMQVTSLIGASAGAGGALGPAGTLQASDGSGHLAAFGGDLCLDAAAFVKGLSPTGLVTCAVPSTASIQAPVLASQAHAAVPHAVNLGALPSGVLTAVTSGGIAAVSTVPAPVGRLLGTTDVQEVTQTTVTPRIIPLPMSVSPLIFDISTFDEAVVSDLLQDTRINNPTGTARPGQWIRLKVHTNVPRALTWGTVGTPSAWTGFLLPTSTTGGTTEDLFLWEYNARTGLWEIIYNSQWVTALGATGVTPGTHPCPASLTVSADGRITAITDGTLPCGGGDGGGGPVAGAEGDVQMNQFGALGADSGNMVIDPASHSLGAANLSIGSLQTYQELSDTRGNTVTLSAKNLTTDRHQQLPDEDGEICLKNGSCFAGLTGGGNVSTSGTPVAGQVAEFVNATSIQGVAVTGTGSYVKGTAPTLTLPNATGLPLTTGVTGRLPYANVTAPSTSSLLLGRGATTGDWQEIVLGTNLSMSGTTLNATGGSGGAPTTATYVTTTADATLTNEVNLGGMASGIVKSTVSAGTATVSTVTAPSGALVGDSDAQSLSNKRLPPRVTTLSSAAANPSFQCDFGTGGDQCEITATSGTSGNLTVQAPIGTMQNGEMRMILFLCTAAQTFVWDAIFISSPNIPLPASCPAGVSNWFAVGFRYSTSLVKFQALASN